MLFQQVLLRPDEFHVIATPNLNGDYLSDALAAQVVSIPGTDKQLLCAAFDARRQEVYYCLYRVGEQGAEPVSDPGVGSPEAIARETDDLIITLGDLSPAPAAADTGVYSALGNVDIQLDPVDALLAATQAEIVIVASPSATHEEDGLKVIGSGRHCILEKPMATTHAAALRLVEHMVSLSRACAS